MGGLAWNTLGKAGAFWMFLLGPALTLPLLFGWRLFGDRRVRPLVVIGGISVGGLALNTWFYAHYAAPMTGLIYVLVLQGLRHVRTWRSGGLCGGGRYCTRGPGCLPGDGAATRMRPASQSLYAAGLADDLVLHEAGQCRNSARILEKMESRPGRHLAIVRYRPNHDYWSGYTIARRIDTAQVVWAREMDDASNRELTRYFAGRDIWLVDADATPPTISAYPLCR